MIQLYICRYLSIGDFCVVTLFAIGCYIFKSECLSGKMEYLYLFIYFSHRSNPPQAARSSLTRIYLLTLKSSFESNRSLSIRCPTFFCSSMCVNTLRRAKIRVIYMLIYQITLFLVYFWSIYSR